MALNSILSKIEFWLGPFFGMAHLHKQSSCFVQMQAPGAPKVRLVTRLHRQTSCPVQTGMHCLQAVHAQRQYTAPVAPKVRLVTRLHRHCSALCKRQTFGLLAEMVFGGVD